MEMLTIAPLAECSKQEVRASAKPTTEVLSADVDHPVISMGGVIEIRGYNAVNLDGGGLLST